MSKKSKILDLFSVMGGGLAFSAVVFGAGLLLMGSGSTEQGSESGGEASEAKKEEKHGKKVEEAGGKKEETAATKEPHNEAEETKTSSAKHADDEERPKVRQSRDTASALAAGDAAMARGKPDEAILHYQNGISLAKGRGSAQLLLRLAEATTQSESLPRQKRYEKALGVYARILLEHPDFVHADRVQYEIGRCYVELGRLDSAREALEEHSKKYPEGSHRNEALLDLVDILLTQNKPHSALEYLEPMLAMDLPDRLKSRAESRFARAKLHLARKWQARTPRKKAEVIEVDEATKQEPKKHVGSGVQEPRKVKKEPAASKEPEPRRHKSNPRGTRGQDEPRAPVKHGAIPDNDLWRAAAMAVDAGKLGSARAYLRPWLDERAVMSSVSSRSLLAWAALIRASAGPSCALQKASP